MHKAIRMLLLLAVPVLAAACASTNRPTASPSLAGTWRLVSFEDWDASGNVTHAFGEEPVGYLVYDDTGRFYVNIMKTPPLSAEGFQGTPEQKSRAYDAYAGYFGRYSVDWDRRIVTHHVEGSLNPAYTGTDQNRPFELSGDTLTLGDQKTWRRVFVRVSPGETAPPPDPLVGTWRGVSENAKDTSLVFQPDGRAVWNLGQAFEVRYRADAAAAPRQLDLSGFTSGPLAGRTLLCIYEIEDARRLRLDCEPSKAGVEDSSIRPREFNPAQVQVFERGGGPP